MNKLFCQYTEVSCVRFSCLEEMFTPQTFLELRILRGGHMDQSQDPIGQSIPVILTKEKIICNEFIG